MPAVSGLLESLLESFKSLKALGFPKPSAAEAMYSFQTVNEYYKDCKLSDLLDLWPEFTCFFKCNEVSSTIKCLDWGHNFNNKEKWQEKMCPF